MFWKSISRPVDDVREMHQFWATERRAISQHLLVSNVFRNHLNFDLDLDLVTPSRLGCRVLRWACVCLSVCLSLREDISETTRRTLSIFYACMLAVVLILRRCDMLYNFPFVDDVLFCYINVSLQCRVRLNTPAAWWLLAASLAVPYVQNLFYLWEKKCRLIFCFLTYFIFCSNVWNNYM